MFSRSRFADQLDLDVLIVTVLSTGFSSFPEHYGTREGSSSWFDVLLLRPSPSLPDGHTAPPQVVARAEVLRNLHGGREFTSALTVYRAGDPIVDEARRGDYLVLVALAQYPAWSNTYKECSITVESME